MIIRKQAPKALGLNEPLRHADHKRPVSRRDFIAQGFLTGGATIVAPAMLGAMLNPKSAAAATLSSDVWRNNICNIQLGAGKIPFICFDLAGGANIAGSNVLVGNQNGQLDVLSTAGYSKLGLPGNMLPNSSTGTFIDTQFGLAFHSDSAFLRGMLMTTSTTTRAMVNGAVIPARSENDTGNNPHNPMYGIARAGARGQLLSLIGSQSSDSGGNSMAPSMLMDPALRPTKVDRSSDARGLVDTGDLATMFPGEPAATVQVMESVERITRNKLATVDTKLASDADFGLNVPNSSLKQQVDCAYVKAATLADFSADTVDPAKDSNISAIFQPVGGIAADGEFGKTAAVMKLVVDGMAGAGTITMGGFDYHTGDRATGEARDFRAGLCMGACLEYAARTGKPLMLYVFSDGSLNSNGMIDNSTGGRGKGQWTGDNQSTAASFFLVLKPAGGAPQIYTGGGTTPAARRQQLGYFRASGDVETSGSPGANSVVSLVDMVLLNYMALHGEQGQFATKFPNSVLNSQVDNWIAFNQIVNGTI